jgi:hypothetical protein
MKRMILTCTLDVEVDDSFELPQDLYTSLPACDALALATCAQVVGGKGTARLFEALLMTDEAYLTYREMMDSADKMEQQGAADYVAMPPKGSKEWN